MSHKSSLPKLASFKTNLEILNFEDSGQLKNPVGSLNSNLFCSKKIAQLNNKAEAKYQKRLEKFFLSAMLKSCPKKHSYDPHDSKEMRDLKKAKLRNKEQLDIFNMLFLVENCEKDQFQNQMDPIIVSGHDKSQNKRNQYIREVIGLKQDLLLLMNVLTKRDQEYQELIDELFEAESEFRKALKCQEKLEHTLINEQRKAAFLEIEHVALKKELRGLAKHSKALEQELYPLLEEKTNELIQAATLLEAYKLEFAEQQMKQADLIQQTESDEEIEEKIILIQNAIEENLRFKADISKFGRMFVQNESRKIPERSSSTNWIKWLIFEALPTIALAPEIYRFEVYRINFDKYLLS